jgi:hypothetical protein
VNPVLLAAIVALVIVSGAGAATPEGKRKVRAVVAKAKPKVSSAAPVRPPGGTGGFQPKPVKAGASFLLPSGLEPWRSAIGTAAKRNGVRETLLAAISVQEVRNSDPLATRYEAGFESRYVTGQPIEAKARASGWAARDLATSYGLMQVMGAVAFEYGFRRQAIQLVSVTNSFEYGARHFSNFIVRYFKDAKTKSQAEWLALVAYNGGHGAVLEWQRSQDSGIPAVQYANSVYQREQAILKGLDPRSI